MRKGYNFSNVRIDGFKKEGAKPMPWDVSNFSVTYAYNEITRRNVNIENSLNILPPLVFNGFKLD